MKRRTGYLGILTAAALLLSGCGEDREGAFPEARFETPPLREVQEAYASLVEPEEADAAETDGLSELAVRPEKTETRDSAGKDGVRTGEEDGAEQAMTAAGQEAEEKGADAEPSGKESGKAAETGGGAAAETGSGAAAETGSGAAAETESGKAAETGSGKAAKTGSGAAAETGSGAAAETESGKAAETGGGEAAEPAAAGERSDSPADFAGVTQVALEKVRLGEEELYRMGNTDYLMMEPLAEDAGIKRMVAETAAKWNGIQAKHPELKIYTYFVNRARDMDWYEDSGFRVYSYADYFESQLGLNSQVRFGQYRIPDMQAYMETGYKTDFHVNHRGSYGVYEDVYRMMEKDMELSPLLQPLRENEYDSLYFVGQLFTADEIPGIGFEEEQMDEFRTYSFDLGDYDSYVGGKKMIVGLEEEYEEGTIVRDITFDHQFSYYGGRADVIRFDFHQPKRPNLLIISDSQGRPSRKLIASHFNQTWFIDDTQYRSMDLERLIEENRIGAVLLIGQYGIFQWFEE